MGSVYRAERTADFGMEVAVKIGPPGWFGEAGLHRFHAERQILATLDHPNVARVLDGGATPDGRPYLVMELVRGDRIDRHADANDLSTAERVRLLAGACAGVAHAHARGIVHRDLKPSNILVSGNVAKVVDFGLATAAGAGGGPTLTRTGDILGTPGFLSPEQASGRAKAAAPAADVFALGATLYALLTGRPPFRADTPWQAIRLTLEEEPVPPARLSPGLSRDLESICLKCLEKDPARRYPSAAELADDLERYLGGRPVSARPVGRAQRAARWARRRPLPAALIALLVAVALGSFTAITLLWRSAVNSEAQARAHAQAAEQRNKTAREALRMYTTAANKLFRTPDAVTPEEREALARALELYEQVLTEAEGGDPDEEHAAAYATLQLANGMYNLGEYEVSARTAGRAVAVLNRLKDAHPDRARYAFHYAEGCAQRAGAVERMGRAAEGAALRREAIRVGELLVALHPDKIGYRGSLASFRANLGRVLLARGALDEAEPLLAAATADSRALLAEQPDFWARYSYFAGASHSYATLVLRRDGDVDRYLALQRELMDLIDRTRRERPADWHALAAHTVHAYQAAAVVLDRAGRTPEAREVLARGAAVAGEIARRNPADIDAIQRHSYLLFLDAACGWPADPGAGARFRAAVGALDSVGGDGGAALAESRALLLATCPDPAVRDVCRAVELARRAAAESPRRLGGRVLGICLCEAGDYPTAAAELGAYLEAAGTARAETDRERLYRAIADWHTGRKDAARAELADVSARMRAAWDSPRTTWDLHDRAWRVVHGSAPPPRGLPPKAGGKP